MSAAHGSANRRAAFEGGASPRTGPRLAHLNESQASDALLVTGWSPLEVELAPSPTVQFPPIKGMSLRLDLGPIKTVGFQFPAFGDDADQPKSPSEPSRSVSRTNQPPAPSRSPLVQNPPATSRTKLHVPSDVVKLSDRLFYLLQPPLESWLASSAMSMPHTPFAYQLEGVAFLYPRVSAVLADEMGLGKTMQAITAIRLLFRSGELRRVLVVCPKPLVANWQREFQQWAPEIPLLVVEGDQPRRRWQWRLSNATVKIANYELLIRDHEAIEEAQTEFDLVVLDESQRIKNRHSSTAQIVRSISRKRSWALTGTPVENSAEDLVGIFEFVAPGRLSDEMKLRRMGRLASDYVLRRTKDKVLKDLPPRLYRDAEMELGSEQRESYRLAEERGVLRLTEMGDSATIQHVFELILRLKQICNFDPATGQSTKLERLAADLEEVASSGRKAVVFSQWVSTLDRLKRELSEYHPLCFHGQIPSHRRGEVLQQFREDSKRSVLLLSYGAGGVGLNLQFANYAFLFDRWWNPAVEDQAINRVHRIGSTAQVTVTRFLAVNTIEQRIDTVLRDKREIFQTIFAEAGSTPHHGFSRQEIFGLLRLDGPKPSVASARPATL